MDAEVKAMGEIAKALESLEGEDSCARVLKWAYARFAGGKEPESLEDEKKKEKAKGGPEGTEWPGIAKLSEEGDFQLTVRDLKAKSTNDAAVRLAHVVIHAHNKLTGEPTVSSKKVLLPILKNWRAATGNTRTALKAEKGIGRTGDMLSLDEPAHRQAEAYIKEILDDSVTRTRKPPSSSRKKKRSKKKPG